jgi:pimeloyl-ACP methyl ester carboxylesterase
VVVLWHSLLCDGSMWTGQIRALSERFQFLNIDAPGHGRSSSQVPHFTLDDCVRAAEQVLDAAGVQRAVWCGLSWGGMVGMRLAARRPERITALVIMDSSARAEAPLKRVAYRALTAVGRTLGPSPLLGRAVLPMLFSSRARREQPELGAQWMASLVRMDRRAVARAVAAVVLERDDCTGELARIRVPTLVLVCSEDRATPAAEAHHLAAHIPRARLAPVAGAGHLSAWEQPGRVNGELARFLGDVCPRS